MLTPVRAAQYSWHLLVRLCLDVSHCFWVLLCLTARNNATPSPDEQFLHLSLEEGGEGDAVLSGISESLVQDVKKSAIELLAIRSELIDRLFF